MPSKTKYKLEYLINTSPKILYPRLSSSSGLSEWFADDVSVNEKTYVFTWDGYSEEATVISKKLNEHIKFQKTEDKGTDYYFEFRIVIDPLTNDLALNIIDFEEEDELEEAKQLWDSQVQDLIRTIGG